MFVIQQNNRKLSKKIICLPETDRQNGGKNQPNKLNIVMSNIAIKSVLYTTFGKKEIWKRKIIYKYHFWKAFF